MGYWVTQEEEIWNIVQLKKLEKSGAFPREWSMYIAQTTESLMQLKKVIFGSSPQMQKSRLI